MADGPLVLYIVVLVVSLILSAFFSGTEAALLSLQRAQVYRMVHRGVPGASRVASLAEHPQRFLPTILLGNTLVNTAAATVATAVAIILIGSQNGAIVAATIAITVCLLLFGETIPKTLAIRHAETVSRLVIGPLFMTKGILAPVSIVLQWVSQATLAVFGSGVARGSQVIEEELKTMIAVGRDSGAMNPLEAELLERVFRFGDRQVREVMTPRTQIVSIERGETLDGFLSTFISYPYSWFPVSSENTDNIVGVLSSKDVLQAMARPETSALMDISLLLRPAVFTPETKLVSALLQEFQMSRQGIAVAVDEFGVTSGVVTLSQLVEEVMGPMGEDDSPSREQFFAVDERTFLVDAGTRLDEINQRLDINLPEDVDYETIAGFLMSALGHIPNVGEQYAHESIILTIAQMNGVKVETVRIVLPSTDLDLKIENGNDGG